MDSTISGTTNLIGEEIPKRKKTKGIKGRPSAEEIRIRQKSISNILASCREGEMSYETFLTEFNRVCREKGIKIPSKETIRTDLLAIGYRLNREKLLCKTSEYDPITVELIRNLFIKSSLSRITVQIKSDEYILLPLIRKSEDETEINTMDYFNDIGDLINNSYSTICTISILISFNSTGFESSISQLLFSMLPNHITSYSVNTYGILLYSTVESANTVLHFIHECLPNTLYIEDDFFGTQPF